MASSAENKSAEICDKYKASLPKVDETPWWIAEIDEINVYKKSQYFGT